MRMAKLACKPPHSVNACAKMPGVQWHRTLQEFLQKGLKIVNEGCSNFVASDAAPGALDAAKAALESERRIAQMLIAQLVPALEGHKALDFWHKLLTLEWPDMANWRGHNPNHPFNTEGAPASIPSDSDPGGRDSDLDSAVASEYDE